VNSAVLFFQPFLKMVGIYVCNMVGKQLEVFSTGMKLVAEVVGTPTTLFSWEF